MVRAVSIELIDLGKQTKNRCAYLPKISYDTQAARYLMVRHLSLDLNLEEFKAALLDRTNAKLAKAEVAAQANDMFAKLPGITGSRVELRLLALKKVLQMESLEEALAHPTALEFLELIGDHTLTTSLGATEEQVIKIREWQESMTDLRTLSTNYRSAL